MKYLEWDACISCGLDIDRWVNGDYDDKLKIEVIAFHNMRSLVRAHTSDAQASAASKKTR